MTMPGPILVTGGAGFIGSHVRLALAAAGRSVRCLDLTEPTSRIDGEQVLIGSVTDADMAERAVNGVGGIIHAAAIAELWRRDAADYDRVNVEGTETLLKMALKHGVPFLYVSSFTTLIGRNAPDGEVLDESVEVAPNDLLGAYPKSKRRAELAVLKASQRGLRAIIAMPSAPVGPGDRSLTPPSRMIRDLASGKTPALVNCLLNMVDAQALAQGIVKAFDHGRSGERYLLCGADLSMRDLADRIAIRTDRPAPRVTIPIGLALLAGRIETVVSGITGTPPTAPLTGVRLAARRVRFDGTKAATELDFRAPSIDASLDASLTWMAAQGLLD